VSGYG